MLLIPFWIPIIGSCFGAVQNRLEHAYDVNRNTQENTQATESRIRDTDMANEMISYSQNENLAQAMLAQASQLIVYGGMCMKSRMAASISGICILLTFSGCSGIGVNATIHNNGESSDISEDSFLEEIEKPNSFDSLIERNGSLFYTLESYMKDGTSEEYTIYKDGERYVMNDSGETCIIEDDEVYGYDLVLNVPYRMLFLDNYDEYIANTEYTTLYTFNRDQEIVSIEEKDSLLYLETVTPVTSDSSVLEYYGYTKDEVDSIIGEYIIDAVSNEILEADSYAVIDGVKTLYYVQKLKKETDKYIPDQRLIDDVFGEDIRTVTVFTDAGTDREKKYTQTVKKGGVIRLYPGSEFYSDLYTDKDCVAHLPEVERSEDTTIYLKRKVDYSDENNWAYFEEGQEKDADLFLIAPTVDIKDEHQMSMDDDETKESFLGSLNMERGIYEEKTRMFAPYYRQGAMKIYSMSPEEREPYLLYAYDDIAAAFEYYLENENKGRPIVLAGFSQGADMCYRLLEDYFADEELQKKLVAVYAIGWPCTEEMVKEYPQIKPATSETDTGVVVSFDCEAPDVTDTFITPQGTRAYTINPLNWKTDGTPADRTLNLGACFTDYDANITKEIDELCGCYIDEERGIIKVTDIDPADYPAIIPGLPEGAYHIYDYQFFYTNLKENVDNRVRNYVK